MKFRLVATILTLVLVVPALAAAQNVGWVYYGHPSWSLSDRDRARFEAEYPACEWGGERMQALLDDLFPDAASRWDWDRVSELAQLLGAAS